MPHARVQSQQYLGVRRQLGFVNFDPLKPVFLEGFTASHAALPTLPHLGPLEVALDRNWSSTDPVKPPQAPALVWSLVLQCSNDHIGACRGNVQFGCGRVV